MKTLIVGVDENGHDELVRLAFIAAGGVNSEWRDTTGGLNQVDFDYAIANDFDAIINSYVGVSGLVSLAESNPSIMLFMPTHGEDLLERKQLVVIDAGQDLQGGYYEFRDDTQTLDSYSNGYICGQLFDITDQVGCTLVEARIRANATLDTNNIINVTNAVAYTGEIEFGTGSLTAVRDTGFESTITLGRIIDSISYDILINDSEIITGSLVYNFTMPGFGKYKIKYRGTNGSLVSDWSEEVQINYQEIKNIILK